MRIVLIPLILFIFTFPIFNSFIYCSNRNEDINLNTTECIKQASQVKMPKYKKTLPGPPYVKFSPLTEGFQPGVGYIKNLLAHRQGWAACCVYLIFGGAVLGYKALTTRKEHPDMDLMYHESYKVRRKEDVDDPTRDCYN